MYFFVYLFIYFSEGLHLQPQSTAQGHPRGFSLNEILHKLDTNYNAKRAHFLQCIYLFVYLFTEGLHLQLQPQSTAQGHPRGFSLNEILHKLDTNYNAKRAHFLQCIYLFVYLFTEGLHLQLQPQSTAQGHPRGFSLNQI